MEIDTTEYTNSLFIVWVIGGTEDEAVDFASQWTSEDEHYSHADPYGEGWILTFLRHQ